MKKTAIIHGSVTNPAGKKAVEILSRILLDYTFTYPECFCADNLPDFSQYVPFFIGTKESNQMISEKLTASPEEYSIRVKDNSVTIEGFDERGVLYGCVDFYNKYLLPNEPKDTFSPYHFNPFEDDLPECTINSAPSVKDRGIWTWGHVIYDYRKFLDNMLMLKMNTLIMWNDRVPFNAKEIIDYAHQCGIKVIWGYSWGWDTSFNKFPIERAHELIKPVFEKFEREYAPLNPDGIYFQSFTEVFNSDSINGVLIADAVTDFVNSTATQFFEKYPELELQFGLHSDSVREKTEFIKNVDKRIRIVWENCGSFPFHTYASRQDNFEETMDFVSKIATLRGMDDSFGVVTKSLSQLYWEEFEHMDGRINIGVSSDFMKQNRVLRKSKVWKNVQSQWLACPHMAYDMIRHMCALKKGDFVATALVEDGMFEENIMYPAALYSEMLWDCNSELSDIIKNVAQRSYVTFA